MRKRTERTFTEAVLRALCAMPDTFAYETDTKATAFIDKKTGKMKLIKTMSRGKADIAVVVAGLAGAMELKMPGRKPEPHQIEWATNYTNKSGGFYFLVYDSAQAVASWRLMYERARELGLIQHPVEAWRLGMMA